MNRRVIVAACLLTTLTLLAIQPTTSFESAQTIPRGVDRFAPSEMVEDVPYVWQQITGYCFPSALSMALQSMGYNLELGDLFATTGVGFSAIYVNIGTNWAFFAGVLARQIDWFYAFADLYGFEASLYLDTGTDFGAYYAYVMTSIGNEFTDYNGNNETPIDVVRSSIDAGYPLVIAADTYYLPAVDWDIIRTYGAPLQIGGVSHAITIIGYDDITRRVQVLDPGVGLNADNYGYPDDGRYNYSMSYATLDRAWGATGYATFRLEDGTGMHERFQDLLIRSVSERLLGNRTRQFQGFENYFYMSAGKDAFQGLGLDMTPSGVFDVLSQIPSHQWTDFLLGFSSNLETFLTMQYYSYREALKALPDFLSDYDLDEFMAVAEEALPHMEAVSHNESVKIVYGFTPHGGLITDTFYNVAQNYASSSEILSALQGEVDAFIEIAEHAFAIADAWERAGNILASLYGSDPVQSIGHDTMVVVIGGGVLTIVCIVWLVRRRSHEDLA